MLKEKFAKMEVGAVLPLREVIAAIGIQLLIWSDMIEKTDPNEAYEPFAQMSEEMLTHSQILSLVEEQYPKLCRSMKIHLPLDIGVVRIKNPLLKEDAAEAPSDDGASDDSEEGSLPF